MTITQIQNASLRLRNNKVFELFVVSIIILSALLIGAKTYQIPDSIMQLVKWLDLAITVIFLFEITIRFIAEENKKRFFHSAWNVFDTLIVIVSLIPIDDSEMALVGRLVRIFRVLRMVSIIPELRMLLNSLLRALPQLGYVLLLMFIIFYIYAAVGATFFAKINPQLWGDISISLLTLFRVMTFEDWDRCNVRNDGRTPSELDLLFNVYLPDCVCIFEHGDWDCGECVRRRTCKRKSGPR